MGDWEEDENWPCISVDGARAILDAIVKERPGVQNDAEEAMEAIVVEFKNHTVLSEAASHFDLTVAGICALAELALERPFETFLDPWEYRDVEFLRLAISIVKEQCRLFREN